MLDEIQEELAGRRDTIIVAGEYLIETERDELGVYTSLFLKPGEAVDYYTAVTLQLLVTNSELEDETLCNAIATSQSTGMEGIPDDEDFPEGGSTEAALKDEKGMRKETISRAEDRLSEKCLHTLPPGLTMFVDMVTGSQRTISIQATTLCTTPSVKEHCQV